MPTNGMGYQTRGHGSMSRSGARTMAVLHLAAAILLFGLAVVAAWADHVFTATLFAAGGIVALLHRRVERLDDNEPPGE